MSNSLFFASSGPNKSYFAWKMFDRVQCMWVDERDDGRFVIKVGVEKEADFYMDYDTKEAAEKDLIRMVDEVQLYYTSPKDLERRLSKVEEKTENLWNCPGMPGYIDAQKRFQSTVAE